MESAKVSEGQRRSRARGDLGDLEEIGEKWGDLERSGEMAYRRSHPTGSSFIHMPVVMRRRRVEASSTRKR